MTDAFDAALQTLVAALDEDLYQIGRARIRNAGGAIEFVAVKSRTSLVSWRKRNQIMRIEIERPQGR
jgi:hypothetical protein